MPIIDMKNIPGSVVELRQKLDTHRQGWKDKLKENRRFYRGEQWTRQQIAKMEDANATPLTLNDYFSAIRDKKAQILRGKPVISAFPRDVNDAAIAKFYRDLIHYILYTQDYTLKEDMVVTDALVAGLGWLECLWNPLLEDRQGDVEINYLDPLIIYPDIEASLPDFSDGEFMMKVVNLPTERVKVLFPEKRKDIIPNSVSETWTSIKPSGDYQPNIEMAEDDTHIRPDRTELFEVWLKEHGTWAIFQYIGPPEERIEERVVDWHKVETNRDLEALIEQYDEDWEFIQIVDHRMKIITSTKETVLQNIYSDYAHNTFPFVPFVGVPTEEAYPTSQGEMVKEQQKVENILYSLMVASLTSMNNPIWLAAQGLIDSKDLAMLEAGGMKPGAVIKVKPPIEAAIRREPGIGIDASVAMVMQMLETKMERLLGVRASLRGEREQGVKSGRMLQTLINQASIALGPDVMPVSHARKQLGKLIVAYVQQFYSPQRSVRIVGQDRMQQIQQIPMPLNIKLGKYDIIVGDISAQPQNTMEEFLVLAEMRAELGIMIPDDVLIDAAPIANKEAVKQRIMEQQQMMAQLQMGQQGAA